MQVKEIAPTLPRYSLGAVTLWFGISQLFMNPNYFLSFLPSWTMQLPLEQLTLITLNGVFDTVIGLLLLIGYKTRITAAVLTLHLWGIAASVGYNDVAIRDLGLSIVAISIVLQEPDQWSYDAHGQHH